MGTVAILAQARCQQFLAFVPCYFGHSLQLKFLAMFLGAARRFATRSALASRPVMTQPLLSWAKPSIMGGATRSFAAAVKSPRPLSMRNDSLMFKCIIAALVYFVPQDVVFLSGL